MLTLCSQLTCGYASGANNPSVRTGRLVHPTSSPTGRSVRRRRWPTMAAVGSAAAAPSQSGTWRLLSTLSAATKPIGSCGHSSCPPDTSSLGPNSTRFARYSRQPPRWRWWGCQRRRSLEHTQTAAPICMFATRCCSSPRPISDPLSMPGHWAARADVQMRSDAVTGRTTHSAGCQDPSPPANVAGGLREHHVAGSPQA